MKPLRIGCSPLTGTIFAGHVLKDGVTWSANKTDVTSDVLKAVIDKIGVGNTSVITVAGKPAFEISIAISEQSEGSHE